MKTATKRKRCKACNQLFTPRTSFQRACRYICAAELIRQDKQGSHAHRLKVVKAENRKERREFLDRDKAHQRDSADYWFNRVIRLRDGPVCISCGNTTRQMHAGHYRPKGAHAALRYAEDNCHAQCSICNNHKSGNLADYRINLADKIGLERVEWLEGPHETPKRTAADYKAIAEKYKAKAKALEAR